MKKRTKKIIGGLVLGIGALGTAGAFIMKKSRRPLAKRKERDMSDVWARPGMRVTFRAELKPGRDSSERTFTVAELLPNGRVLLEGVAGEHTEKEFEPLRYP
jgi:hypothetical protein